MLIHIYIYIHDSMIAGITNTMRTETGDRTTAARISTEVNPCKVKTVQPNLQENSTCWSGSAFSYGSM